MTQHMLSEVCIFNYFHRINGCSCDILIDINNIYIFFQAIKTTHQTVRSPRENRGNQDIPLTKLLRRKMTQIEYQAQLVQTMRLMLVRFIFIPQDT